jgi:hypothetical protein
VHAAQNATRAEIKAELNDLDADSNFKRKSCVRVPARHGGSYSNKFQLVLPAAGIIHQITTSQCTEESPCGNSRSTGGTKGSKRVQVEAY